MVRVLGLAIGVAACWACAPAQADVISLETPSVSVPAAEQVVSTVAPVVDQVTASVPAAPAPAADTIRNAAGAAEPAVKAAVTTTTARVAQRRAGDSGGLRVGASSLRRVPSARLRHAAPPAGRPASARDARQPGPAERPAPLLRHAPMPVKAHATTARPDPGAPPSPPAALRSDGGISAGAAAGFAGGLAMLAFALVLVAPRMRRRLSIDPAALRPVAFVALLERPG
jgi:hypothetical protein